MILPRKFCFWTALLALPFLATPDVAAARTKAKTKAPAEAANEILSIYSNLCAGAPGGDISGQRIILINAGSDTYVMLQTAQGELMRPESGDATIDGAEITFKIDRGSEPRLVFHGKITPQLISGSFGDGRHDTRKNKIFHFKRQPNKVTQVPLCK
jgi:hypothetical protein